MSIHDDDRWVQLYSSHAVRCALHSMSKDIVASTEPTEPLVLISILKGGLWTAYQLLYHIADERQFDIRIGHMGISSYGDGRTPGKMKVVHTLDLDVEDVSGGHVWIIDDIWDTGGTMREAQRRVQLMQPGCIETATLVSRVTHSEKVGPSVCGFKYEGTGFLVGCGMGIGELDRHHSSIYVEAKR